MTTRLDAEYINAAQEKLPAPDQYGLGADRLRQLATTGVFELRDAVGLKFQREHKPGSPARIEYDKNQSREAKAEFRKAWAKRKYSAAQQGKTWAKSAQTADRDLGEIMAFGAMVVHYGGWQWQPAIEGAKNTAAKCVKLGGDWAHKDKFSGLMNFWVLREQHLQVLNEK